VNIHPDFLPFLAVDNFATDAAAVREAVLAGGFESKRGPDGAMYTGISQYAVPQWFKQIEFYVGAPITPKLSCFRLNLAGELPHSWVHSDDICAKWASVLYLNTPEQCAGGTAFWRHERLGMNRLLSREELTARGMDPDMFYQYMSAEWKNLGAWRRVALMPMAFNRFITYPTCFFHSRWPFEAFGNSPADGRLIWVCFYDLLEAS
jgi:hypothetical protein